LFPGTEDFGILPVEAMASGRPVLAFDAGGARETVSSPQVGFRFGQQTTEALLETMAAFEEVEDDIDPHAIRAHSLKFSSAVFRDRLSSLIEQQLSTHGDRSAEVFRRRPG
jgi:glycosyltransferase involved in cell wall biosynthesis